MYPRNWHKTLGVGAVLFLLLAACSSEPLPQNPSSSPVPPKPLKRVGVLTVNVGVETSFGVQPRGQDVGGLELLQFPIRISEEDGHISANPAPTLRVANRRPGAAY